MEVNIHHAKTNLSQLILKAESGEDVVIARAGKPVVRLVPVNLQVPSGKIAERNAAKQLLKNSLKISPDFFDPKLDEEIAKSFNESPLLYTEEMVRQEKADKKSRKRKKSHKNGANKR
jgi:prevent-host-death family protein